MRTRSPIGLRSKLRHCAALALLCVVAAFAVFGCQSNSTPAPAPAPPQKLGVNVNSPVDIGSTLAEIGIVQWNKTAIDAVYDAGTTETAVGVVGPGPVNIPIAAVTFNPQAALTASDTNNAVISVWKRNAPDGGGGTTQTLLASASTFTVADGGTGSWNPFTPVSFKVASGAFVSPGDCITVSSIKNGTVGVLVPQGELNLFTSIQ